MIRKQDDFYEAINGNWEKTAVIPEDKVRTGGFSDLADDIEDWLLQVTKEWQARKNLPKSVILKNFIAYHRLASDINARKELGVEPVQKILKTYQNFESFSDFANHIVDLEKDGLPNMLPLSVAPDFKDARNNVLWAGAFSLVLPDTTYYEPGHAQGEALLGKFRNAQTALLSKFGFSSTEIDQLITDYLALDAKAATVVLSQEEGHEYAKLYHPYEWHKFTELAPELPLNDILKQLIGEIPDQIIVPEERFWAIANQFYSQESWPLLKSYLIVKVVNQFTDYLSEKVRVLGGQYARDLTGLPEAMKSDKAAFYLAASPFSQAIGYYYAQQKFSPEAKADVEHKVTTMINIFKQRLQTNQWLNEQTISKAVTKLNTIVPHIGYPETLPERLSRKIVDPSASLLENALNFKKIEIEHHWSQWHQPVDRDEWHMPAHLVNAYYDPQQNQIVFPAAILQSPFYSLSQSSSANYGGIGAVIAHEISHAFDTNGASFDEFGSLNNWWTDDDFAAFKLRTNQVVQQFDGLESYGAKINGNLTVSENVADLGGLAAALAAAKQDDDFSAQDFFENWAAIWRMKARPEYMQLLAASDPHGPAKLRVNIQVKNFDTFFETFNVTAKDAMWLEPEKRIQIW